MYLEILLVFEKHVLRTCLILTIEPTCPQNSRWIPVLGESVLKGRNLSQKENQILKRVCSNRATFQHSVSGRNSNLAGGGCVKQQSTPCGYTLWVCDARKVRPESSGVQQSAPAWCTRGIACPHQ